MDIEAEISKAGQAEKLFDQGLVIPKYRANTI